MREENKGKTFIIERYQISFIEHICDKIHKHDSDDSKQVKSRFQEPFYAFTAVSYSISNLQDYNEFRYKTSIRRGEECPIFLPNDDEPKKRLMHEEELLN